MSSLKIALIPARGLENYALQSRFHLALAIPSLMNAPWYINFYKRIKSLPTNQYVVLDNGLAEGLLASSDMLLAALKKIGADEIVIPDALADYTMTMHHVDVFMHEVVRSGKLDTHRIMMGKERVKLQAVAQGANEYDVKKCVEAYATKYPEIGVLSFPRHLLDTVGRSAIRIDLANWVHDNFHGRFEIHMLGANPHWVREVRSVATYAPFVRSMDTSMPFNYAIEGKQLASTELVYRPLQYFENDWSDKCSPSLVKANVNTYLGWASK